MPCKEEHEMKKVLNKIRDFFTMLFAILVVVLTVAISLLWLIAPIAFFTLASLMMLGVI